MSELRCSFCGKGESKVARLVAGPSASICNECVVLCVGVLDEDGVTLVTTEGQLLVRFADGSIHVCDQQHGWLPLVHDGVDLEWCAAIAFAQGPRPMAVAAVRSRKNPRRVIGSTFPAEVTINEAQARTVVDAFGGAARLQDVEGGGRRSKRQARPDRADSLSEALSGLLGPQEFTNFLSMQYRIPTINLDEYEVDQEILRLVPQELCAKHTVLPVSRAGSSLIVAFADPKDAVAVDAVKTETGLNVEPVVASATAIRSAIARYFA